MSFTRVHDLINNRLKEASAFANDCALRIRKRNVITVRYYDDVPNIGDQLNHFILSRFTSKDLVQCSSSYTPHILGIGSIAHLSGRGSLLWGCGIIGRQTLPLWRRLNEKQIFALRGHLTLNEFDKAGLDLRQIPLGDPGLLTSKYWNDQCTKSEFKIGIVPHYMHKEDARHMLRNCDNIIVLDVALSPFEFINQLIRCEYILSSSLHGLILSDAFAIPNKWISFFPELYGGTFKFIDYYSTTDLVDESAIHFLPHQEKLEVFCRLAIAHTSVKRYKYSLDQLIDSFPSYFIM